ncbi:sigma 54-interacting transcriptional regulator [Aliifodinibius sp. S!AR15-10]|uniref:sigma-54 interaction domain-containing protein n=1 Tax=Aliifodinibius sp. S!AR15-10 TaxID=2950437 RepID=UPI0028581AC2|nr:sigma 54-interacting transcriptional regulator [Aliifodinibius sp. S!AR15-10]MDR8389639.1 sigma 54-interacting transcriptional regulator [Aliifodinibius sp. S!AR15-10]
MGPKEQHDDQPFEEQEALRTILQGTAAHTGKEFFRELVKRLAKALHTESAWVTEFIEKEQKLRALAFWMGDRFIEGYEYDVPGTPCEVVLEKKNMLHVPKNVVNLFPQDPDLKKYSAMSYLGAPLLNLDGSVLGNLAVMDTHEMPEKYRNVALFKIFADRGASELRRIRAEQRLREREGQLSRLFDSAMDAIIEIKPDLTVTQVNRAALDLFEDRDPDKMLGQSFEDYLAPESAVKLKNLLQGLRNRPLGQRYLWIPGGLKAVCERGNSFQFEATLSCYEHDRNPYCILILRNITDRVEAEKRIDVLSAESEYLREELELIHNSDEIIGQSPCMVKVFDEINQVAGTSATVLISGETGTGKELVARAIHGKSRRSDKPLIKVNCATIPETLIESEFFGHEEGAFTGATEQRKGRFALADGGTIFLDEIGELPMGMQPKLLRVLQEGEFEAVGSSQTQKINARVIAATNRDLKKMIREGDFRADLYYRLNVFPMVIPPLRERGEDILLLAQAFIGRYSQQFGRKMKPLTSGDKNLLRSYDWPGNVRELQNIIERAVITSQDGTLNLANILSGGLYAEETNASQTFPDRILTAEELLQEERQNMIRALKATCWKVAGKEGAAQLIGVPPSTFSSRMKALNIKRPSE